MPPLNATLPWVRVPAEGLTDTLKTITWQKTGEGSPAAGTAALMIYIAMLMAQVERPRRIEFLGAEIDRIDHVAKITYDQIAELTGLSRSLIRQGLMRLESTGLFSATGSRQNRCYVLKWEGLRWFKLPCRAIITKGEITAFTTLTMRTKHELNALKLFLYLADVRDRNKDYTEASYEKIFERTGIPERDIRRAINVLNACGLLAQVQRDSDREISSWGPNRYYLKEYKDLGFQRAVTQTQ